MWLIQSSAVSDEQQESIQELENRFRFIRNDVSNINKQIEGI